MSYSLLTHKNLPEDIYLAMGKIAYSTQGKGLLDEEEQDEYQKINNEKRRGEFISARHLIKGLAAKFAYLESGFSIKKDEMGKPYGVTDGKHLFLSITHSSKCIVCGLSESKDLGVDLEPIDRKVHEGLKSRIFHPEEKTDIKTLDLIRVWTIKEALVKLHGGGLRTNLNDILVKQIGENEFQGRFNDDKSARICSFQHNEHWVSVAYYQ